MKQLNLIGSDHLNVFDKAERSKLEETLSDMKPDFVTLEVDMEALQILNYYQVDILQELQRLGHGSMDDLKNFMYMQLGEQMIALSYCVDHDIPYQPVDMIGFRKELVVRNINALPQMDGAQYETVLEMARNAPNNDMELDSPELNALFEVADPMFLLRMRGKIMGEGIKGIMSLQESGNYVHTSGKIHLSDVEGSLYSHVKDLQPTRTVLK